ncbi:MAG TPA: hypothetical protein PK011_07740 [Marinagarivorans sp.]|nr:hypothetical protein [Cellvibrionaceae bacterium]HMY39200.1 hypothetical protein [Marinagarivorans sp.]HNG60745.1 hypothetical protein [Cellvibrionaceae bacterium]
MFSIVSQLFGCVRAAALSGPDFNQSIEKVIHVGHRVSVFYLIPGNLSRELNFDKIYQRDTAKSYQINPEKLTSQKTLTWREFESIDMGTWDYWGKKSQGPGGQLGSLRVSIGYSLLPKGADLIEHVKQSYQEYLNGAKGLNQKYRVDDMGKPVSPEEYAEDAIAPPSKFSNTTVGGAQFITWETDREFDGFKNSPYIYYVLPIDQHGYLTFLFRPTISVFGQDMIAKQEQRIQQDINTFLSHIRVKPI